MAFEQMHHKEPSNEDLDIKIERLLMQLPEELREHWEDRIYDLPEEEQVNLLEEVLIQRERSKEKPDSALLLPEGIEIHERFPDDVKEMIEELKTSERSIEVGYGKAGHVIMSPSQEDVCYKVLLPDEQLPLGTNDISLETEIQNHVWKEMDGKFGVRVPTIYGFVSEEGARAMTMELLNAPSLRKIVERQQEDLPDAFDIETFFDALESFIQELNDKGVYHRDFHMGNILVDRETGMPCVIDFGMSTKTALNEETAYRINGVESGQFKEIVLQSDPSYLTEVRTKVLNHIKLRNGDV